MGQKYVGHYVENKIMLPTLRNESNKLVFENRPETVMRLTVCDHAGRKRMHSKFKSLHCFAGQF